MCGVRSGSRAYAAEVPTPSPVAISGASSSSNAAGVVRSRPAGQVRRLREGPCATVSQPTVPVLARTCNDAFASATNLGSKAMPGNRQTPTVRLRRLAAKLRSLCASSGLTRDEIVERAGINVATLCRIEHARVRPQTRTLRTLLDLYGVEQAQRGELSALLRGARQRGWLCSCQSVLPGSTAHPPAEAARPGPDRLRACFPPAICSPSR